MIEVITDRGRVRIENSDSWRVEDGALHVVSEEADIVLAVYPYGCWEGVERLQPEPKTQVVRVEGLEHLTARLEYALTSLDVWQSSGRRRNR